MCYGTNSKAESPARPPVTVTPKPSTGTLSAKNLKGERKAKDDQSTTVIALYQGFNLYHIIVLACWPVTRSDWRKKAGSGLSLGNKTEKRVAVSKTWGWHCHDSGRKGCTYFAHSCTEETDCSGRHCNIAHYRTRRVTTTASSPKKRNLVKIHGNVFGVQDEQNSKCRR